MRWDVRSGHPTFVWGTGLPVTESAGFSGGMELSFITPLPTTYSFPSLSYPFLILSFPPHHFLFHSFFPPFHFPFQPFPPYSLNLFFLFLFSFIFSSLPFFLNIF